MSTQTLACFFAIIFLFSALCSCSEKKADIVAQGSVDNLRWAIDEDGYLSFTGNGAIPGVEYILDAETGQTVTVLPKWYDYRDSVTGIIIGGGIDSLSMNSFMGFDSLRTIDLGASVLYIDGYAVSGCPRLDRVTIRAAEVEMEKYCIGYVGGAPEEVMSDVIFAGISGSEVQTYAKECGAKFNKL